MSNKLTFTKVPCVRLNMQVPTAIISDLLQWALEQKIFALSGTSACGPSGAQGMFFWSGSFEEADAARLIAWLQEHGGEQA